MKTHIETAYPTMLARQSCYVAMLLGYLTRPLVVQGAGKRVRHDING